jgi:hypothetical protein
METLKNKLIGCWIDGAVPRTNKERAYIMLGIANDLGLCKDFNEKWELEDLQNDDTDCIEDLWNEREDDCIDEIEYHIANLGLVVFKEAGDVIIAESEELDAQELATTNDLDSGSRKA